CVYFEFVSDDTLVVKQPVALALAVSRYGSHVEILKGPAKAFTLFQNRKPVQPRLIYFQRQPLKQSVVCPNREPVFALVVWSVKRMAGGYRAITQNSPPKLMCLIAQISAADVRLAA